MLASAIVIAAALGVAVFLFSHRLRTSRSWQATLTPLASIIGSGFLVAVPLLADQVGNEAVVAMTGLIGVAFLIGGAVRFNIKHLEPKIERGDRDLAVILEDISHLVLALAYVISVAYYLSLLAVFLLKGFGIHSDVLSKVITTVVLAGIGTIGRWRGLDMLERVEKYAVGINLTIIGGLLAGLVWHATRGQWQPLAQSPGFDLHAAQVVLGVLICVQGFETSRYLGGKYSAEERIRTMRDAQLLSAVIYILFFGLITGLFGVPSEGHGLTMIIDAARVVAPVLPFLIIIAAMGSQFSASVADTLGSGGLLEELTRRRLSQRSAYVLSCGLGICLVWLTDLFGIIAIASKAFAAFYAFQCAITLVLIAKSPLLPRRYPKMALYGVLCLLCLSVVAFGVSAG